MKRIKVELDRNGYEIYVGPGLLWRMGKWLRDCDFSGKLVIVTDPTVKGLYGDRLAETLTRDGFQVTIILVPEGEEQKSLQWAGKLYEEFSAAYVERLTPVVALGGGVIGDLAGFVASTYMRGVPLIQAPTTLLAQVDSSIGGKVAVDHDRVKNKIGSFYQPRFVVTDTETLKTLSASELANGLAEIIKSAAVRNAEFFGFLEENLERFKSLEPDVVEEVVYQTARIKTEIVEKDERDLGLRGLLNFGHTIGHAIESASDFRVGHGRAVSIGISAAARVSAKVGTLREADAARLVDLVQKAGLPTTLPDVSLDRVMQAMRHDKKVLHDKIRLILLKAIGNGYITDEVSPSLVEQVLANG